MALICCQTDNLTFLPTQVVFLLSWFALPHEFTGIFTSDPLKVVKNW